MMKQTILVVEDDEMIRSLIQMHLEKHDYEVVEASTGKKLKICTCSITRV